MIRKGGDIISEFEVIVVGSGLSGSTAARILAEAGYKVLITEKRKHVGGNVYDYKNEYNITIHKYGPHIFHTNYKDVWDFANRFAKFRHYQHKVLSYVDGRYIPFPINLDTIRELFGVSISVNEMEEFLRKEVEKSAYNDPPRNFKDVIVSQVGERLYETFFKNYTIKQWEKDPEELSPEVAKRIPIRFSRDDRYFSDKYQGIPERGYTDLVNKMLDHENITVMLGADYFEVRNLFKPKLLVYTGELDRFFDYTYGKLEYRSLRFECRTYDVEYYQPVAVVNYPNDYDFTRITEYKYFLGENSEKTTVCFEYPKSEGIPYYVVLTKENEEKREKYMREVEKLEKSGEYLFIGRLAEYKYYNMDQAIKMSMEKVKNWQKNFG